MTDHLFSDFYPVRPFIAPRTIYDLTKLLTPDEDGRLYIGQGQQVELFEQEFAELVGSDRPILSLNSCTSAITLALWLSGVRAGDWVIATPMTCSATVTPVLNLQANILWADVDPITGLIDPKSVAEILCSLPTLPGYPVVKAILAVDWAGASCDYAALKQFGIPVIQDAAHRVFALNGEHGDWCCWSFQAIKHLTTGDGGGLYCPSEFYGAAKLLRWYGLDRESKADFRCSQNIRMAGYKFHMNDIAATIGRANLKYTREIVEKHRKNARALGGTDKQSDYWFYPTHVENRTEFIAFMKERGIAVSQVHRRNDEHECFARYRRPLPGLDRFAATYCGLPSGWWLTLQDIETIQEAVQAWNRR